MWAWEGDASRSLQRPLVSPETGLARFSPCGAVGVGLAALQPSAAANVTGLISHLVTRAGVREFSMRLQELIWTGAAVAALAAARGAAADADASGAAPLRRSGHYRDSNGHHGR